MDVSFDYFTITPDDSVAPATPNDEFDGNVLDGCRWDRVVRWNGDTISLSDGALGGPEVLRDSQAGQLGSIGKAVWSEFEGWENMDPAMKARLTEDEIAWRESVARGARIFRDKMFLITDSAGINSPVGFGNPVLNSCVFCHNMRQMGNDVAPGQVDLGTTNKPFADPAPHLPLFRVTCKDEPHPHYGRVIYTQDPGFGLVTGRCADVGKITLQSMRGLAARPPYFSNGSAADLRAVVDYYDRRYNIGYTDASFTVPNGAVAANFDKTVNFKNVSPKVSLDYQLTPEVMVYGAASRGFKSGGYNIRANTTAVPRSGEPFNDESVDSFEVGTKMGLLDQRLFLNLAAFHNIYEDIQLSVFTALPGGGFFGDFTNAGKGTVNGVEAEYQWLPTDHWVISGNLAWLDAKYDEFISGGVDIADTQYFTNAPEFSGAINLEYRTDLANGGNLSARVGYSYQSEVWPTTDLSPEIRQGGYGLVNAGVIWRANDDWSFSLQGTNLADEEYRTTGYNLVSAGLGVLTGFYGPPRQYSLTARYDF